MTDQIKAKIQAEALSRWKMARMRGLLQMGTGTGKSKVALNRIKELYAIHGESLRVLLAVPTTKLRDENWPEEAKKWGMEAEYQQVEGFCYVILGKKPQGHYHLVILDEAHRSTEYNARVFENITFDELMALSATVDKEKEALLAAIAPTVFRYSLDQGVQDGVVSDYRIKVIAVPADDTKKTIKAGTKAKPFMTTEKKHLEFLHKQEVTLRIKLQEAEGELAAAQLLLDAVSEKKWSKEVKSLKARYNKTVFARLHFIQGSKSKTAAAKQIMAELHGKGRLLVFAGSIAQAEELGGGYVYHSKSGSLGLTAFKTQQQDHLVVVNALNEGHNIPNLDYALVVQASSNERDLIQRIGRVVRLREGHVATIYVLAAQGTVDERWVSRALSSFDEAKIQHMTLEEALAELQEKA